MNTEGALSRYGRHILLLGLLALGYGRIYAEDLPGWRHVIQVGDTKAVAELAARPRTLLRTDGVQVPGFTPQDGVAIAEALRDAGLDDDRTLAQALLGTSAVASTAQGQADQSYGPGGRTCPLLLTLDDEQIRIPLQGGYVSYVIDPDTMTRIRRFSVDDAVRIKRVLEAEGYGEAEVMSVWLGLIDATPTTGDTLMSLRDFSISADPLNPPCNQCQNGRNCNGECCNGSPANCTVCTVCP